MAVSFYFLFSIYLVKQDANEGKTNLEINYNLFFASFLSSVHYVPHHSHVHSDYLPRLCFIQVTHAQSISNSSLSSPSPSLVFLSLLLYGECS